MLSESSDRKESCLQSQLFYKDTPGKPMDDSDAILGTNYGLQSRARFTSNSKVLEMEGPLYTDVSHLSRFLLNNVDLKFVLWQSNPEFHLMAKSTGQRYRTKILNATLNVCHVFLTPHILIAHSKVLAADHSAIYPYKRSEIKKYVVPAGSYSFSADDIFLAQVPQQVVIALVEANAVAGSYLKNPYNFKHFNTKYLSLQVNGENTPSTKPFTPKFLDSETDKEVGHFMNGFLSLQNFKGLKPCGDNGITRDEYGSGYMFYCYNLDMVNANEPGHMKTVSKAGNVRCEIMFEKPLDTSINILFYAQYNSEIRIDKTRSVEIHQ